VVGSYEPAGSIKGRELRGKLDHYKILVKDIYRLEFVSLCPRHPFHLVHRHATKMLQDIRRVISLHGSEGTQVIAQSYKTKINKENNTIKYGLVEETCQSMIFNLLQANSIESL